LAGAFEEDLEALLGHLKVPFRHRVHMRTTNLLEGRRTKVFFNQEGGSEDGLPRPYQDFEEMAQGEDQQDRAKSASEAQEGARDRG